MKHLLVPTDFSEDSLKAALYAMEIAIESDTVNETIHHFILQNKIDLLAMAARKHRLFEKLFSLSHTRHFAFHSEIPLLVLHAGS